MQFHARLMRRQNRGIQPRGFPLRLRCLALHKPCRLRGPCCRSRAIGRPRSRLYQSERSLVAPLRVDRRNCLLRSAKRCSLGGHRDCRQIRVLRSCWSGGATPSRHGNRRRWDALTRRGRDRWSRPYSRRHHRLRGNRRHHRLRGSRLLRRRRDHRPHVVQTWAQARRQARPEQRLKRRLSGRWIGSFLYPPPTVTTGARCGANPSVSHPNTFDSPCTGLVARNR
jgi:hypothetical protein